MGVNYIPVFAVIPLFAGAKESSNVFENEDITKLVFCFLQLYWTEGKSGKHLLHKGIKLLFSSM